MFSSSFRKRSLALGIAVFTAAAALALPLMGCGSSSSSSSSSTSSASAKTVKTITHSSVSNPSGIETLKIDMSKWQYDEDHGVYYQIGLAYCVKAQAEAYEKLAVYVPAAYFKGKKNSDGTYTCTVDTSGKVNGYTAKTAPFVMPLNTAGYSAQEAVTSYDYSGIKKYMKAGYIYVFAGCRGRENGSNYDGGAPWGVTDLKAAIRYLRYNAGSLAGDTSKIFVFGHSGGGAQSTVLGASGDSGLYLKYLKKIGAAMKDSDGNYISDAVTGVMAWCPITNLDTANEAYEWMMGQFSSSGTRSSSVWTSALSDDMAEAYADYINALGLKSSDGTVLKLSKSSSGIYLSGSYYKYLMSVIEKSLNNFLKDTEFPYTESSQEMADMSGGAPSGSAPSGASGSSSSSAPPSGSAPSGSAPSGASGSGSPAVPSASAASGSASGTTYKSAAAYIKALNADGTWIQYDKKTNTAKITSLKAFVKHCKSAAKDVGAFDSLSLSQAENSLFGTGSSNTLHFDQTMADLLKKNASKYSKLSGYKSSYASAYAEGAASEDALGVTSSVRQNMYNPMYYLSSYYEGYQTSNAASYWRIRTGINQTDTSLTTEMNLALALKNNSAVKSTDFATVWGQGHTTAERAGNSTSNFIKWVDGICK